MCVLRGEQPGAVSTKDARVGGAHNDALRRRSLHLASVELRGASRTLRAPEVQHVTANLLCRHLAL